MKPSELLSEAVIQRGIIEYLEMKRYLVIRINSGAMAGEHKGKKWFLRFNSAPGCSDLLFCQPETGKFGAFEVKDRNWEPPKQLIQDRKTKRHKINPKWTHYIEQKTFIEQVIARRGIGAFVKSIEDVIKALEG